MVERGINKWVKGGLRFAAATALVAAFCLPEVNTTEVKSEVGGLSIEPIHLVVDDVGQFQYFNWNLSRIWPRKEDNPELIIKKVGTEYPAELLLTTKITTDGVKICAYNYPETKTCHDVVGTDISNYPVYTNILSPNVYLEVGSTRLEISGGPGRYTEVMELTDPATKGLMASASATIEVPRIYRAYIPYVPKSEHK